mgnify:CR=1 FL=1
MTQPYRGAFLYVLDAQQERGEAEVDQQGEGIHDGGDLSLIHISEPTRPY